MEKYWAMERDCLRRYLEMLCAHQSERELGVAELYQPAQQDILTIDSSVATLGIAGVLTRTGPTNLDVRYGYGGTGYGEILTALEQIDNSPAVRQIVLRIDSPGGELSGVDEVFQAIYSRRNQYEIITENNGLIASAAYWIAVGAHKIIAKSPSALTGSVGVISVFYDDSGLLDEIGVRRVILISANAPGKTPLNTNKAGLDAIQQELNALERVFYRRITEGRGISREVIERDFGRGGCLVASDPAVDQPDAVSVGMIDRVVLADNMVHYTGAYMSNKNYFASTPSYQDFDVVDIEWDADAAIGRVRKKTGSEEAPSKDYKKAFFWYDRNRQGEYGGYKLPYVDVVNGRLVAIKNGVRAANAAMAGARRPPDIPTEDREEVQAHIDKYRRKIQEMEEEKVEGTKVEKTDRLELSLEKLEEARAEGRQEVRALIGKVKPYLSSDKYGAPVRDLAIKVLGGESSYAVLEGVVTVLDATRARTKTEEAIKETNGIGETAPIDPQQTANQVSADGVINNEVDLQAAIERVIGKKEDK